MLPVNVSEKSLDHNSDAPCLVWYADGRGWTTSDIAGTAEPFSSFRLHWLLYASGTHGSAVGLTDSVLDWVQSFLMEWTQQITDGGQLTAVQPVLFEVFAGILTLLDPLLYILYANELPLIVAHHGLNLHQYAVRQCQTSHCMSQMGSCSIWILWLRPAADHGSHRRFMSTNATRWWSDEPTQGWWWCSHLAENYGGNKHSPDNNNNISETARDLGVITYSQLVLSV